MTSQDPWNSSVDVVVVGIGAAGAAAAIAAHDAGARVLVLEKMSERLAGGNTRLSGGIWFDNTDPGRAEVYLRSLCGEHTVPHDVIRVWARETAANTDWMKRLGVEVGHFLDYRPEYPELDGSDCYGGYFGVAGKLGHGLLYDALLSAIRARGIELRFDTPVVELVQEHGDSPPARISGVIAESDGARLRIRARCGVVLATGGFESNPEMVSDHLGLVGCPCWGTPAATGDGHKMAQKAGADLWHMNNMAAMTGFSVPGYEAGFAALGLWSYKSYLFVGMDGRRFVDETAFSRHGHALLHGQYEIYPYRRAHVIFDEAARQAGPLVPSRRDFGIGWNILVRDYEWSTDNLAEIERGWLLRADSVEELANRLGLEPASLRATVALYNRYCAGGCDEQFNRPAASMAPLAKPPFYAFTSAPVLGWTNGGLRRDADARVLDTTGDVIPGLYAAGTASGTYSWCKDGGFHIADALAFGRVAGRNAAADRE